MEGESTNLGGPAAGATDRTGPAWGPRPGHLPGRAGQPAGSGKAHTRESDAIAAARRRLPMLEIDPDTELIGPRGPLTLLDAFEGHRQLIAYYFMWHPGHPAAEQCEGCTWVTAQIAELSYLHSRDITYADVAHG